MYNLYVILKILQAYIILINIKESVWRPNWNKLYLASKPLDSHDINIYIFLSVKYNKFGIYVCFIDIDRIKSLNVHTIVA